MQNVNRINDSHNQLFVLFISLFTLPSWWNKHIYITYTQHDIVVTVCVPGYLTCRTDRVKAAIHTRRFTTSATLGQWRTALTTRILFLAATTTWLLAHATRLQRQLLVLLQLTTASLKTHSQTDYTITTRLNAFAHSCLFNATAVAAQCYSEQTNSDSQARCHHQVRNV